MNWKQTNPDLALIQERFSDQVQSHGSLDKKTRFLVLLASHVATQSIGQYKETLTAALDSGVTPVEVREALYQTIPYVGMSKAYDFIDVMNDVFNARGVSLPLPDTATVVPSTRLPDGLAAQKTIFGETIDNMRASALAQLQHIQDYLSANCFGDYYTRAGLDLNTRELLTFATLISLGGADAQVLAHAGGNLNVGNDRMKLLDVITQLVPYIGYPRSLNAIAAVNKASTGKE